MTSSGSGTSSDRDGARRSLDAPVVIGVRHHSPACARLVGHVVRELRPRFVLIEGPSEMNDRLGELLLGHELPIALYSYLSSAIAAEARGTSRGSFSPFCAYSPEWVALTAASETGAEARFIDLPSYDDAFMGVENRYSDRHLRASDRMDELCKTLGFEDTDSLWDHLFEGPSEPEVLRDRLNAYFTALRGDEPGGPRDDPRESFMARWIGHAMREAAGAPVVVVCGGYHAPVLERAWREHVAAPGDPPSPPRPPEGARVGTYLVPYSFHRLDAFTGYQSGMPSPAYYQAVWEHGARDGAELMLRATTERLRKKRQQISAADLIGATAMTEGLTRIRAHVVPLRTDVLDGLAAALLKDAVSAPLPWTRRGPLAAATDPMLVEMVAAFSGERHGRLAAGTPRPPLVADTFAELALVGVEPKHAPASITASLITEEGKRRSRVLHRLRILGIPDFSLTHGPSAKRGATDLSEKWQVALRIETDAALIEAAAYGATLEAATHARLAARAASAGDAAALVDVLFDAVRAGISQLGASLLAEIRAVILQEPLLARLGSAMARLLGLVLHGDVVALGGGDRTEIDDVLRVAYERAAWLFEGLTGADVAADRGHVDAVVAMRDVLRHAGDDLGLDRAVALDLARRRAADVDAPSYVKGAGLGLLVTLDPEGAHAETAARAVRAASRPTSVGDFLIGVFALAREEIRTNIPLLTAIDGAITGMSVNDFLIAVPALRQAFSFFPPREKRDVARALLSLKAFPDRPHQLLEMSASPAAMVAGLELDQATLARARLHGLFDE